MTNPRSPFDRLGGMCYFPRMLDKIRLNQRGELSDGFSTFLGEGFDGRICRYLEIEYEEVSAKVIEGASDEAVLAWLEESGKLPNEERVFIWNEFVRKRGDGDDGSALLEKMKAKWGVGDREDLRTFFEFMEVDEGRKE